MTAIHPIDNSHGSEEENERAVSLERDTAHFYFRSYQCARLYCADQGIKPPRSFPPGSMTSYCIPTPLPSGVTGDVLRSCLAAAQALSNSLFPAQSLRRSEEMLKGLPIAPDTSGIFFTDEITRWFCSVSVTTNSIKSVVLPGGTSFAAAGPAWDRPIFFNSCQADLSA